MPQLVWVNKLAKTEISSVKRNCSNNITRYLGQKTISNARIMIKVNSVLEVKFNAFIYHICVRMFGR